MLTDFLRVLTTMMREIKFLRMSFVISLRWVPLFELLSFTPVPLRAT